MTMATMGQYIREYESHPYNGNSLINGAIELFHPVRWAFGPGAVIVQEELFADCSFYQLEPYWDLYRTKARAVVIRAGQGNWVDVKFKRNWSEAKRVGLARGAYWFYDGRVSPGAQAQLLVNLLKGDLPEMEIICDWERNYGGSFEGLRNVVAFMQAVEAGLPGATIGMYTGYYFFKENSNAILNTTQYQYLKSRPLWLGWYAAAVNVIIPAPWEKLTHWQWGTPNWGISWGMNTVELDMNYFNGSKAEFGQKYLDGAPVPPVELPDLSVSITLGDDVTYAKQTINVVLRPK